jgi:drug/metabolite transporter (DMT)-like permease
MTACLIWSICNVLNKAMLDFGIAPLTLLTGQLLVSTPVLWIVTFLAGRRPKPRHVLCLMGLGILQPGLAYGLSIIGLTMTSATIEALLFSTETLFIIALAWAILRERPSRITMLVGLVGSIGVALVSIGGETVATPQSQLFGAVLILTGVLAAALYSVKLREEAMKIDALSLIASCQTGGLLTVIVGWFLWPQQDRFANLTIGSLSLIALSGIFMHAIGFVLFAFQLRRMSVGTASLTLLTIPIMTSAAAYIWLGDRLTATQLIGAAIVILALMAMAYTSMKPNDAGPQ